MSRVEYGETWAYESIVGGLPGIDLPEWAALALQIVLFEVGLLLLAWWYDVWAAVPAGTAAVVVAGVGSLAMLRISDGTRSLPVPRAYTRLLFGSSIEVVLAVLSFVALITHLFVFDPQTAATPLLDRLFEGSVPVPVAYLTLLVLWDLCYRIGTSWWMAVVDLWSAWRLEFPPEARPQFRRLSAMNVGFGLVQLALVPFLTEAPTLLVAVAGHVVAVASVSGTAAWLVGR
ncbi:MAG: hypothetical protein ABEJ79_05245 [Halolamina sp.]